MHEWRTEPLERIAEIRSSNVDKKTNPGEEPVRLCNYMDVYSREYITEDIEFMEATATPAEIQRFGIERGDVMITKDSETPDDIGIPTVVVDDIPKLVCGYHVALIKPNRAEVDPLYLAKQLGLADSGRYYGRLANGSTRYGLSYQSIARTPILLAPLPQQQRIAEILSTVDEAIEQTEVLIAKIKQIKAGLMHDLFTRGVTSDGQLRPPREEAPQLYKESPLGWIPKEWDVRPLDKLADVNRGKFTIRPRNDPRYYNGQYPFIQTGDVALAGGRVLANYSQTLNSLGLGVSRLFPVGTIMVTIAANIADTCILGIPMCAPDSLVGVVPNAEEVARFLELCIRRRKRWFENRAPQTAQKNINLDDLRPMLLPYPAPDEQFRIAERYEAIDAQLLENEEAATKLGMFKHGLMQDLLSGAVPVAFDHKSGLKEVAASV
jgi:type I restriction enzyme, S subunit